MKRLWGRCELYGGEPKELVKSARLQVLSSNCLSIYLTAELSNKNANDIGYHLAMYAAAVRLRVRPPVWQRSEVTADLGTAARTSISAAAYDWSFWQQPLS